MKAVLCKALGKPDALVVEEVPAPPLGAGRVRIDVHACGVNFADTLIIAGHYQVKPRVPFSPGMEVAGTVVECGQGVTRVHTGDRVMAVLDYGGYAEQVVAVEQDVFPIPDAMDFIAAAGFPVAYGTSHLALVLRARLCASEALVVHGAAGGVGLTAVEIGKAIGATVIATASGEAKLAIAQAHGADHLIDYQREDIRERVLALTGGRGADVVYDPVGGDAFAASLRSINWSGRILVVGFASGEVPQIPANILLVKNISLEGIHWGSYRKHAPQCLSESFATLSAWYARGRLQPRVSETFQLERAAEALAALRSRRPTGKLVLTVAKG
jgi:NADPH2:quinone reductase